MDDNGDAEHEEADDDGNGDIVFLKNFLAKFVRMECIKQPVADKQQRHAGESVNDSADPDAQFVPKVHDDPPLSPT